MTNLEKIKQMSDEQLAKAFLEKPCKHCNNAKKHIICYQNFEECLREIKAWLNSEVEE